MKEIFANCCVDKCFVSTLSTWMYRKLNNFDGNRRLSTKWSELYQLLIEKVNIQSNMLDSIV